MSCRESCHSNLIEFQHLTVKEARELLLLKLDVLI